MTLSGRLPTDRVAAIASHLQALFADAAQDVSLDRIAIVMQTTREAPFRVNSMHRFGAAMVSRGPATELSHS
jgi:hypothetical protein